MKPIIIMAVLAIMLNACSNRRLNAPSEARNSDHSMSIFVDPDTGCEYIGVYGEAITPRIATDGKTHSGCKGNHETH